jgi:hypothetical protein
MDCRKDVATIDGAQHTLCAECHAGSVKLDSSMVSGQTVRFDQVLLAGDSLFPRTDSLHTNGAIDLNFTQCVRCHSYPPRDPFNPAALAAGKRAAGHAKHVLTERKKCIECHFALVESEVAPPETIGIDTLYTFTQRMIPGLDGSNIPIPTAARHRNHVVDIVFKHPFIYRPAAPGSDTLYKWNSTQKTCSNLPECHGQPGDSLYGTTYWGAE